MRVAIALLFSLLLAGVGECDGKGLMRSSHYPGGSSSARYSGKWKYAAAGAAGGVVLGYGLAYSYYRYNSYRRQFENDNWYRRSPYYNNWRSRPMSCTPTGGLREGDTDGWVVAHIRTNMTQTQFKTAEFEVDLFNELMYRTPCFTPTQAAVLSFCTGLTTVTDADLKNPARCTTEAVFTSEHTNARRRLLQNSAGATVVVAIGVDEKDERISGTSEVVCVYCYFLKNNIATTATT